MCKFCLSIPCTDGCPRDMPGAYDRYNAGWCDGSRYLEPANSDVAYMAGWRQGDCEADEVAEEKVAARMVEY